MDPVCSLLNIRNSIERYFYDLLARDDDSLFINKDDYDERFPELKSRKSGFLWDVAEHHRTHHWSAQLYLGSTTINDFGNQLLHRLTDRVKYAIDCSLYIPVYDYEVEDFETNINTLVLTGPIKQSPVFKEPNDFKTVMFIGTLQYVQPGYL